MLSARGDAVHAAAHEREEAEFERRQVAQNQAALAELLQLTAAAATASAWSTSATMSSGCSSPIDVRMVPGPMPLAGEFVGRES
ncbi:MAG: hypothetical protein QM757_14655 [Paludibaculum sp.]